MLTKLRRNNIIQKGGVERMKRIFWLAIGLSLMASVAFAGTDARPLFMLNGELTQLGATYDLYHSGEIDGNQLKAHVADGTTPLLITSTTVVDNLNVDQVDGLDASATAIASTLYALDATGKWAMGVIPDSIPDSKLATITTADKVSGSAIQLNAAGAIVDSTGLMLQLDDSNPGLQITGNKLCLKLKAGGGLAEDASGLYITSLGGAALTVSADTSGNTVGDVVYINGNGTVADASATDNTKKAIGIVSVADASGSVVIRGRVNVTGGIVANTMYYLATAAGTYTTTPPSANGNIVQAIGRGWSTTDILVDIHPSITVATD